MPWDRNNTVAHNHIHHIDGIMGDGGAVYTLGVQGNRPFHQGSNREYPALPLPPLKIQPMSVIHSNWIHNNGWSSRPGHGARPGITLTLTLTASKLRQLISPLQQLHCSRL